MVAHKKQKYFKVTFVLMFIDLSFLKFVLKNEYIVITKGKGHLSCELCMLILESS